jgi:hypothetical protein
LVNTKLQDTEDTETEEAATGAEGAATTVSEDG